MKSLLFSILAYCLVSVALFGDPLQPFALLTLWSDRLLAPWPLFMFGAGVVAATIFFLPRKLPWLSGKTWPLFVAVWMVLTTAVTVLYVDRVRGDKLAAFAADLEFQHSLLRSFREAPREFQTYLHAGALKDCVPYGWSYRKMDVYRLPPNTAVNVLPSKWIDLCEIERS